MTPDEIRAARKRLGLSQIALATLLGLDNGTLSRWERGAQAAPAWLPFALRGVEATNAPDS